MTKTIEQRIAGIVAQVAFDSSKAPLAVAQLEALFEANFDRDAIRYRYLRDKICFTGNGDGSSSMHAINLPSGNGFPEIGSTGEFIDKTIDQAIDDAMAEADVVRQNTINYSLRIKMSIKKTKTWSAYRRLLRRYRIATESLLRVPIEEGNPRYIKAEREYKACLAQLDAFMLSHIAIRAIVRNLTIE